MPCLVAAKGLPNNVPMLCIPSLKFLIDSGLTLANASETSIRPFIAKSCLKVVDVSPNVRGSNLPKAI